MDQKTGILQKDRRSETWTVISRIDSLWNHISQKRKDFESKPDTGLMSKDVVRVVHKFVQYVLKVNKLFWTWGLKAKFSFERKFLKPNKNRLDRSKIAHRIQQLIPKLNFPPI